MKISMKKKVFLLKFSLLGHGKGENWKFNLIWLSKNWDFDTDFLIIKDRMLYNLIYTCLFLYYEIIILHSHTNFFLSSSMVSYHILDTCFLRNCKRQYGYWRYLFFIHLWFKRPYMYRYYIKIPKFNFLSTVESGSSREHDF